MVEDDVDLLGVAALRLESMGCEVIGVESAEEALRLIETMCDRINVVFTDLRLGGIDGAGLIEQLNEVAPDLPIVATSALIEELDVVRARWGNRVRLIPKPYQFEDLRILLTLSQSGS